MKRLIAAVSILSVVLVMCIAGLFFLKSAGTCVINDAAVIKNFLNEEKTALALVETNKAFEKWLRNKKVLKMFVDHTYLNEIDVNFTALKSNLSSDGELNENLVALDEIITRTEHLLSAEKFSLENVL